MAIVARLAGALLVIGDGRYFLVGDTKEPCDWNAAGFAVPAEIDPLNTPYVELDAVRSGLEFAGVTLDIDLRSDELARRLSSKMLVQRNGSVSERLWNLACGGDEEGPVDFGTVDAQWLGDIPEPVWNIVRDAVLRCL